MGRHRGLALAIALAACARPAAERAAAPATQDPAAAALAEGRAAWASRADPGRRIEALDAFRRAARLHPGDPVAELPLARAEAFRALAAADAAEARAAHDASGRAAERALRALAPDFTAAVEAGRPLAEAAARAEAPAAEALHWLALGRMGVAQATGHAAVLAVKDHVLALEARAAALDERLDAGGPLRALGAWSAMLPVAAGGGAEAARARFARAAELFPAEPWRRVAEASSLCVLLQDGAAFDRLLWEVLATAPASQGERAPELELAQRRARALLDKRASLF
jgi:tetratricopeptide (TPR) repeat protein